MAELLLDVFPTGLIQANCVLVGDPAAGTVAIIDPGAEPTRIVERVEATGLTPALLLHTHGHLDHAGGTGTVARRWPDLPIGLHRGDLDLYRNLPGQGQMFGFEVDAPPEPTLWLEHGQRLPLGGLEIEVRHTPGHSPGGVCFVVHEPDEPVAVVGDLLFAGAVGRTDLWGGSAADLARSIREQLYTLPAATRIVPGHGPITTVGEEQQTNPFVRG
jgi:glyoxylase-like metal-dependent hydrolase (beta-lactamase superfamily II)